MATEQRILKQDGYLDVGDNSGAPARPFEMRNIVYHPQLNVLLLFGFNNVVKVLDVNSGVVLQTYKLSKNGESVVHGRYMPLQDKILFWDGHNVGLRGDYNGVLLLDTILQAPIGQNDDYIKLEIILSEAIIFQHCINDLESEGLECPCDISNELTQKINKAQKNAKKGIKAQRWNTICLEVPYSSMKLVANNVVILLKRLERHIPVLAIASAINERLTDMMMGSRVPDFGWNFSNFKRVLMHSEAVRRQTFEKWPHMDYKWALPDQMAQAGFYHQPSSSGEDRAMCFTCNVCLVCWEKTDEPWSEHERHSPICPFVKGEYTQNVPLSITYATSPALSAPGLGFDIISNSDYANVLCTSCSQTGELSVWSIERHLRLMYTFHVPTLLKDVFEESFEWARVTAICVLPNARARTKVNYVYSAANYGGSSSGSGGGGSHAGSNQTSGKFGSVNAQHITSTSTLRAGVVGSKIVLGVSVRQSSGELALRMVVLNIVEVYRQSETSASVSNDSGSVSSVGGNLKKTSSHIGTGTTSSSDANGGGGGVGNVTQANLESKDDDNKAMTPYEKFADGFDSNGFVSALMTYNKNNGASQPMDDASVLYDFDLCTLSQILDHNLEDPLGGLMVTSNTVNVGNLPAMGNDMDKLVDDAEMTHQNINNNNNNNNNNDGNSLGGSTNNNNNNNNNIMLNGSNSSSDKLTASEEIECVVESWTSVNRTNALDGGAGSGENGDVASAAQEIVEIAEIMPSTPKCNQLLVKLLRTKAPETEGSKIIMATVAKEDEEEEQEADDRMDTDNNADDSVAAQLLLFDYEDQQISHDYTLAMTFSRAKCPKQLCVLPNFNSAPEHKDMGAICVVCADGSVEIYSLADFQATTVIEQEGEHFESVVYCRNMDRLCCCSRQGGLLFYSLNEGDNDSGDELLELEDECSTTLTQAQAGELSVTDGTGRPMAIGAEQHGKLLTVNDSISVDVGTETGASTSGAAATHQSVHVHTSPSAQSMGSNNANFLAYKTSDLTLDDLRVLHALTQFDDKLTLYSAEVPSCWNDLGQVQKQRKQSQNMRHGGDERDYTRTWRLHNDATTWDEHIIELNLAQPVSLGHIDLKFTVYQQCPNPAAIQVTLLKQNTNGFGYRMKGPHASYKPNVIDDNIDLSYIANENPVLSEEYLLAHNAEVLAGPIELSSCIDVCDQGGTATLTSPKLFKTRTRNFLLHIKTVADPSKEGQTKTRASPPKRHKRRPHHIEMLVKDQKSNKHSNPIPKSPASEYELKRAALKLESQSHLQVTLKKIQKAGLNIKHLNKLKAIKTSAGDGVSASFQDPSEMLSEQTSPEPPPDSLVSGELIREGCDWLHEISISVRAVKSQSRISNARMQRIAMLESNGLMEQLLRIASDSGSTPLTKNLALDILNWICFIRLNRFRSPKSERLKDQINKQTAANIPDLLAQQFECVSLAEKHIEQLMRNCIIYSERSTAHKCSKLIIMLTEGVTNLPTELQLFTTLDYTIKEAITNTFHELPRAQTGSVVRWYTMLTCATSTAESNNSISEQAINLLKEIAGEIDKRWDPCCALLSTRFGLYGYPFEPEIFDFDFPNLNRHGISSPVALTNVIRSNSAILKVTALDIKRLSSIDGVDFRTFPYLIRGKSISNQLRGLLEVVQLHFSCVQTSEATRIDNIDSVGGTAASSLVIDDVMIPKLVVAKEKNDDVLNDLVNDVESMVEEITEKEGKIDFDSFGMVNGFKDKSVSSLTDLEHALKEEVKNEKAAILDKLKLSQFLPDLSLLENYILKKQQYAMVASSKLDNWEMAPTSKTQLALDTLKPFAGMLPAQEQAAAAAGADPAPEPTAPQQAEVAAGGTGGTGDSTVVLDDAAESEKIMENLSANPCQPIAWHKLITPPPKQMIIIDRMHSGARRFVVLDFGQHILLTDVVIPPCDELTSLNIDIWCFDEETDCTRLVQMADIQTKTLVLSDIQPPPICRFLKVTIIGRIGMSSTKCKVPLGRFFGHPVVLEHDGYGDQLMRFIKQPKQNLQAQLKSLNALYEDVHCRYSLASTKLMDVLAPMRHSELSNVAHLQAFINKQRDEELGNLDNSNKVVSLYDECMLLQYQINVIRNVVLRLERAVNPHLVCTPPPNSGPLTEETLRTASRDKLRVLSLTLVEVLLHFSIEYGIKNILPVYQRFNAATAKALFNSLVVYGDAQLQLATCSLLVVMCCFQPWWGDFLAETFCSLFSAQNCKAFPQDRIFFLLTYLGRRSIGMGACRSIVIDAVLKTLLKLLAPISPHYKFQSEQPSTSASASERSATMGTTSDLQLITWLLLFLSVCLDDNERKDKSAARWDFMSCESDFTKTRPNNVPNSKQLRCFKKRIIQQSKYSVQPYTDWGKKIYMIQNEVITNHPGIFMELSTKAKSGATKTQTTATKINMTAANMFMGSGGLPSGSSATKTAATSTSSTSSPKHADSGGGGSSGSETERDSNFDKGLKTLRMANIKVVIRGLFALLLEMDFDCNMDQFLLTCKVIARLVAACRPSVQLCKIVTTAQLEQLVRLAVWNDQQQPWAVHAITCLLQDLLDADKQYRDSDVTPTNDAPPRPMEPEVQEARDLFSDFTSSSSSCSEAQFEMLMPTAREFYQEAVKYNYLPSLIECDDAEFDDMLNDIDMIERTKPVTKKESNALCKNTFNFFCKSISVAMDSRLDVGLELHVETQLRRLTNRTSLDLYASLPQVLTNEFVSPPPEAAPWPEYLTQLWSGSEYNGRNTYVMFKNVFDSILADLHYEDTWVHLEQVLQMWLTLNCELAEKPYTTGISQTDVPRIPFGANAVQGLLLALAWHNDIKLRTWCLGFQCLLLACNSQPIGDDADCTRINEVIVNDENFEKMLLRFFSGYGMSSSIITNRCAGPTICKHLHDLLLWLHGKTDSSGIPCKRQLKDILLHVVLQLVQPGGAISNQQGPIDAQNQLVRDLLMMPTDKGDLNIALKITESVSFLVFNNISNGEKLQCQRGNESNNPGNNFSNLFANVLGSENPIKQNATICDNSLIINLLRLSSHMVLTEMPRQPSEVTIPEEEEELSTESQTDETKAEQLNTEGHRSKVPCIADWVLRQFPTMKRLFGTLSQCSTNTFTMMSSGGFLLLKSNTVLDDPQTIADAVFSLMITLSDKASNPRLVVAPICQYLEETTIQRNATLPRLPLSEPFLWYISKVLEVTAAVQTFTQLGGIHIICHNLVRLNKTIINMQPGLISLIMQHMTRNTRLKLNTHMAANSACKKTTTSTGATSAPVTQHPPRSGAQYDGLINFAPFSHIVSENDAAQSAEVLISNPNATHRRPRSPAWSYMFYPNETHVDLTITLPTAILLKEVQLVPHTSNLASCPSAVALELSRDYGVGSIPIGAPMATTGLTCIRLKLSKAEVATSIVIRLYKPKDCGNVGLVQIAVLGQTIFGNRMQGLRSQGPFMDSLTSCSSPLQTAAMSTIDADAMPEDDAFAKTSIGWVRILSRCFHMAALQPDTKLADLIAAYPASYPGFLEACCSLLNIMPMIPSLAQQHLETILLKLGAYNHELSLQLLRTLLWHTTPQVFKLSSDAVCDLIHEVVTGSSTHLLDKLRVLIDWIMQLHDNYSKQARCNNPQSGFVKVIASILWRVHVQYQLPELPQLITSALFETCFEWVSVLEQDEPLKSSFDSLLCALCFIKPELFNQLLVKLGVKLEPPARGQTDDSKVQSGSAWFRREGSENLMVLLERPTFLKTLALACQSPAAVYQMLDSGLPKLLAHAVYEYCTHLLAGLEQEAPSLAAAPAPAPAQAAMPTDGQQGSSSLTDFDKAEAPPSASPPNLNTPLLSSSVVPKVLDFFAECCAEGPMRNWLGTMQGSVFWKPLLQLLCHTHSSQFSKTLPMQQSFIRLERSTINFLTRVSACHPENQEVLTSLLIGAIICKPLRSVQGTRPTISGFTRQLVLQLLLENEHITVAVRSQHPLQRRDTLSAIMGGGGSGSGSAASNSISSTSLPVAAVNNHPAKRSSAHYMLFNVTTSTTCQEILMNCVSDPRASEPSGSGNGNGSGSGGTGAPGAAVNSKFVNPKQDKNWDKNCYINLSNVDLSSLEFLSVGAAVAAKDKRIKDAKNLLAVNKDKETQTTSSTSNVFNVEEFLLQSNWSKKNQLVIADYPNVVLSGDATISQVLATLEAAGHSLAIPCLTLDLVPLQHGDETIDDKKTKAACTEPLPSPLQRFSSNGGLSLLAHYLPTVYPEHSGRKTVMMVTEKEKSPPLADWVKLEPNDEIYEDLEDTICEPVAKQTPVSSVPQHSLAAFGLFLRLPAYSDVLLRDKLRAQCLLRLVLGVTGDGEGNDIYSLSLAPSLPTLPFEVFRQLLDTVPLSTDDGMLLRRVVIEVGAMHLVLNCLGIFSHQSHNNRIGAPINQPSPSGSASGGGNGSTTTTTTTTTNGTAAGAKSSGGDEPTPSGTSDDKSHMYWAKGTGFGTGSTTQSWNVEQALLRQKSEEEHVTVLLLVLASYINPGDCIPSEMCGEDILAYHDVRDVPGELPALFQTLLQQSCLIPALSSYLRNDSVLDITRHIPLYRAILKLLRALSLSKSLVSLLQPAPSACGEGTQPIAELLTNMKTCVDTYAKRLKVNKKSNIKGQTQQLTFNIDDGDDEGLALLIPDIQETSVLVQKTTDADALINMQSISEDGSGQLERPLSKSVEQRYLELMKKRQFDTFDMIVESENNSFRFVVSHHFEKMVRLAGDRYHPSRVKRLAQEAVTLSTSLPLSYSSSVFVRCDTDRLDVMKVLITGPSDTPYANGCFEFDVFFPPDYPNLPMLINLETTGRHSVRFNPNLYNDGKVCLSVLNTWHGRPEEKWNAQTSSFLQVLVSIQSLILVPEPYFNEPGFERSRGTPSGTNSSREYNSNIYQACVRWAMLEQIRNPSPCFKDVIHKHFWMKREEVCTQIEGWIEELSKPQYTERASRTISFNSMVLRRHYRHLREELAKLKPPRGLEDLDAPFNPVATLPPMDVSAAPPATTTANVQVGTDGPIVPELNLITDDGDDSDNGPCILDPVSGVLKGVEEVVEILSDTENESSVWQEKEEEEEDEGDVDGDGDGDGEED
ncbi:baculoviral IAP repeat-containing protein 6 isoform X3 [Drosophila pseudoobscura]|uniref:Dual E2 ubiquitin-conjugating enzyme/E3 ubiquitin-protein ligase BIRC6 n=1 Tax=Drosophila pseudoobscura pseudoobscura TaxID=46245 RepID=A0A6I8VDU1_DROPS|nr:baculoviral IAP repeat-containing protein 6 isoform X3 [Drosophila pseudoobscura]